MTETLRVGVVVEGHGEREALPVLLRRMAFDTCPQAKLEVQEPIRHSRGRLMKEEGLKRAITLAAIKVGPGGYIIVLVDADEDCPKEIGPRLQAWTREARSDLESTCVLARREFESWFLAGIESLRGCRGIRDDADALDDPEEVANPKGHLERLMKQPYSEILDQPALAAVFDYKAAAGQSRSLRKLVGDFCAFVASRCNAEYSG